MTGSRANSNSRSSSRGASGAGGQGASRWGASAKLAPGAGAQDPVVAATLAEIYLVCETLATDQFGNYVVQVCSS